MAYTTIDDPSVYFQTALYSGNNTTDHNITNDGNSDLQPDIVWIKQRTSDNPHVLQDSSRGFAGNGEANVLQVNDVAAEVTNGAFESFNTNGFGVGGTNVASGAYNLSGHTYVGWQWKVNGGTTSANTAGGLNSTVQVNATAGISIITFTADGTTNTIGHGLGIKPDVVIYKSRNVGGGFLLRTNLKNGSEDYGYMNLADDFEDIGYDANTSTLIQYNDNNTNTQVAYAFAQIKGYSKFGTYYGNGQTAEGPFVYCGFKPAWVMIKNTQTNARNWYIYDNKRRTFNPNGLMFKADTADTEATDQAIDMYSNGFRVRPSALGDYGTSTINHSAQYMFYMAFAESPFVSSEGTPTTAN